MTRLKVKHQRSRSQDQKVTQLVTSRTSEHDDHRVKTGMGLTLTYRMRPLHQSGDCIASWGKQTGSLEKKMTHLFGVILRADCK